MNSQNVFRIFISFPYSGLGPTEIKSSLVWYETIIRERLANARRIKIANKIVWQKKYNALECIGEAVKRMGSADMVAFAPGWEEARGCRVEHFVAQQYGKAIMYL